MSLAEGSTGLFAYFHQSNLAGQAIVLLLIFFSFIAWTLMLGKYFEIKRSKELNGRIEKAFGAKNALGYIDLSKYSGPYASLCSRAVEAQARFAQTKNDAITIGHIENALQREVAKQSASYENKMVMLGSIVSGAPFLGLLGTVWGVMDAFGQMAFQTSASLQNLAPGVSGALLTTVAALLVAIPSVFGYNYLLSSIKQSILELENFASSLMDRIELEWKA
ncbi:MAG: hypothetical protein AUJ82_08350 [Verrucomicrobia bacterium CG1_02_43_26]|nr:MAG: hypothetical protein AUJ82_08350 [Verrucomicrobia bacterium CG1_02_43_26]